MSKGIRSALYGYNALTDTDVRHFSIYTDTTENNVLIKEFARGSKSVGDYTTESVSHNLNYIPFYLAYFPVSSGRYRVNSNYDTLAGTSGSYVTTTDIYFVNNTGAGTAVFKYLIYYDKANG